jgi:hypothetical protein
MHKSTQLHRGRMCKHASAFQRNSSRQGESKDELITYGETPLELWSNIETKAPSSVHPSGDMQGADLAGPGGAGDGGGGGEARRHPRREQRPHHVDDGHGHPPWH